MSKTDLVTVTDVPSILEVLTKRLESIEKIKDSSWKTSGKLTGLCDVKTEMKVENLIKAMGSVSGMSKAYVDAASKLGLTTFPVFKIDGATEEEWASDIKLRIAIITHDEEEKQIKADIEEAKQFLDKEDQKKLFFAKLKERY